MCVARLGAKVGGETGAPSVCRNAQTRMREGPTNGALLYINIEFWVFTRRVDRVTWTGHIRQQIQQQRAIGIGRGITVVSWDLCLD